MSYLVDGFLYLKNKIGGEDCIKIYSSGNVGVKTKSLYSKYPLCFEPLPEHLK